MLSVPHLIIIFLVALVVFGPEKLPELARNFGKVMSEFRRATGDLRSTFEDHLRDLEREAEERRIGSAPSQRPAKLSTGETTPASAPENAVPTLPPSARGIGHRVDSAADAGDAGHEGASFGGNPAAPAWDIEPAAPDAAGSRNGLPPETPSSVGSPVNDEAHPVHTEGNSETVNDGHSSH
jgi:sec-independent protein translocase protein TatB